MLFHVYGGNALYQWGAMILVLVGLILLNEVARRTKLGGLIIFGAVPVVLTIYLSLQHVRQQDRHGLLKTRHMFI